MSPPVSETSSMLTGGNASVGGATGVLLVYIKLLHTSFSSASMFGSPAYIPNQWYNYVLQIMQVISPNRYSIFGFVNIVHIVNILICEYRARKRSKGIKLPRQHSTQTIVSEVSALDVQLLQRNSVILQRLFRSYSYDPCTEYLLIISWPELDRITLELLYNRNGYIGRETFAAERSDISENYCCRH